MWSKDHQGHDAQLVGRWTRRQFGCGSAANGRWWTGQREGSDGGGDGGAWPQCHVQAVHAAAVTRLSISSARSSADSLSTWIILEQKKREI